MNLIHTTVFHKILSQGDFTWFPQWFLPGFREVFTWFPESFYLVPRELLPGSQRGFYLVPRKVSALPTVCLVYPDFPGYPTCKSHRLGDINLPAKYNARLPKQESRAL